MNSIGMCRIGWNYRSPNKDKQYGMDILKMKIPITLTDEERKIMLELVLSVPIYKILDKHICEYKMILNEFNNGKTYASTFHILQRIIKEIHLDNTKTIIDTCEHYMSKYGLVMGSVDESYLILLRDCCISSSISVLKTPNIEILDASLVNYELHDMEIVAIYDVIYRHI